MLGTIHLAETRDRAIEDCTHGLQQFADYFGGGAGFVPLANQVDGGPQTPRDYVEAYADSGNVVIGTPDDAIAYIEGLLEQSGGFGTFLMLGHDWADPAATLESYRLFAREVIPHFQGQLAAPRTSHEWATAKRGELFGAAGHAILNAITSHVEEKAADAAERRAGAGRRRRGEGLMRAAVARGGAIVVRDDVPEPEPQLGQVLVQVKACGICGSDLHFLHHGADMLAAGDEMEGMPDFGEPRLDLGRDIFMGHEFAAEVLEAGPDTVAPAPGTIVTSVPIVLTMQGVRNLAYSNELPSGYGERMLLSAPLLVEVPNGLDPRSAALTEPTAVGLHAVNRSRHRGGRGRPRARVRAGRPQRGGGAGPARHRADRGRRLLAGPAGDGRGARRPRGRRPRAPSRRSTPGPGPAAAASWWSTRPSACPGSSRTCCAGRRG